MTASLFSSYLATIQKSLERGDATEHTHRAALQKLLESMGKDIHTVNEPRKSSHVGKPDIAVFVKEASAGYAETKDVGLDLNDEEESEQLKRYRKGLPSLILTDYLEFRWYVDDTLRLSARLGRADRTGKIKTDPRGPADLEELLRAFLAHRSPDVSTPQDLAKRMARLAHLVRDLILEEFEKSPDRGPLHQQFKAFQKMLVPDLKPDTFADMFAQTIAYGLFAARAVAKPGQPFTRESARSLIPKTNPFLRKVFDRIAGADLPDSLEWVVDDLARLLDRANMSAILKDFGRVKRQEDPVVYFYEDFLKAYNPALRESRGVYYTPAPVVGYIVRSVDHVLKKSLTRPDGLADPTVLVLDPATGTGSFLYAVINSIHDGIKAKGQAGVWSDVVTKEILPRVFGFELLMAPYAVAHLKLGLQLKEFGHEAETDQRLGVYLTNTLEEAIKRSDELYESYIAEESDQASEIKREKPLMVVLGNPPYSGHSSNNGEWITNLLMDYKRGIPGLNKPGQAKWLSDDYVKFIRFGQWRIEKTGEGVLAFVTNHGYLDNPTFRGMRQSLMNTFNEIYILDLHGNSKKKETCPDGSPDENVFDIQQGVAIGIFVKKEGQSGPCKIFHGDLQGIREKKYEVLSERDISTTEWTELSPTKPFCLFIPQNEQLRAEYEKFWPLPSIMDQNGSPAPGIVTTHDEFSISWSREEATEKIERFLKTSSEEEARTLWRLCTQSQWNYERAKQALSDGKWKNLIVPILYRPFDVRWTVYDSHVAVHRRERVMRHMLDGKNLAFSTTRSVEIERFEHVFCTRKIVGHHSISLKEVDFLFPLYLYPEDTTIQKDFLSNKIIKPNLNADFIEALQKSLGVIPSPEEIFYYIYAILHSQNYRDRYKEFLKGDFPRIPLTSNKKQFKILATLGEELVSLHLMESDSLTGPISAFDVSGSSVVEKVVYDDIKKWVFINNTQFFADVPKTVWEFQVGGYQVCQKWLKDRKTRKLSPTDVRHYQKIITTLHHTQQIMSEIDKSIPNWPLCPAE